jgi:hypothetical protein
MDPTVAGSGGEEMKVVFKSIGDEIADAIMAADQNYRSIKMILLSFHEYRELLKDLPALTYPPYAEDKILGKFLGVTIAGINYKGGTSCGT